MLPQFTLVSPKGLAEAVQVLDQLGAQARVLAGGTDVLVQMRAGQSRPKYLVDIKGLEELSGITFTPAEGLTIGALVTHRELELSPVIKEQYQVLYDGVSQIGSVQIRNRGTLGGNICNALPSADGVAPLMALGARLKIHGPQGEREVPIEEFFLGPRQTVLAPNEILTRILIPSVQAPTGGAYLKFTRRKAMDLALLGVAVWLECESDRKTCRRARIGLVSAAPVPLRARRAEGVLTGQVLGDTILEQAGEAASQEGSPRSSWRASEEYRRHLITVMVPRAVRLARARMEKKSG